jgi:type I restriction enzyme S subunit
LPEQKRIVAILDQADALRTKRRMALDNLEDLKKSIFLDMFASHESEEWELTTIEAVASASPGSIRTGPFGSQLLHSEFVDSGVAVLGIDNAVENEFRWARLRYISSEKYRSLARYTVHPGDVLITIMGTCGRCAIVPDDIPLAINTKHLCCITLDQRSCLPVFLHSYFLHHPLAKQYLRQTAKGAVMDGLNMGIIRKLPLQLPPLPIQEEYGRRISTIESVEVAHSQSTSDFDDLFASLQHRAFRGEL